MGSEHGHEPGEPRFGRGADSGGRVPAQPGTHEVGGAAPGKATPVSSPGAVYAIRVEGLLDAHWSEWLGGMTLTHEPDDITRLEGPVIDQAALHGVLNKIRDLRLTIVTLERLGEGDQAAPSLQEPPESTA
jgi:hypothetical protein